MQHLTPLAYDFFFFACCNLAGDAILCCWPVLGHDEGLESLKEACLQAVECGIAIQQKYDNFDIRGRPFRCKVTLASGHLEAAHFGGYSGRREWVPFGETLDELTSFCDATDPGQASSLSISTAGDLNAKQRHLHAKRGLI